MSKNLNIYENRKLITMFTKRATVPYLQSIEYSPHLHTFFSKVYFNIILLSTSKYDKLYLHLTFSDQN